MTRWLNTWTIGVAVAVGVPLPAAVCAEGLPLEPDLFGSTVKIKAAPSPSVNGT